MKTTIFTTLIIFITFSLSAQISINTDGADPHESAMLDVKSNTSGLLPPRMSEQERDAIINPEAGLIIWCNNCGASGELQVFNGTIWTNIVGDAASIAPIEIGSYYQGGVVFYIFQLGEPGYVEGETHGLMCAINDQDGGSGIAWYNGAYTATGAEEPGIGKGPINTALIISSQGAGTYAATVCTAYDDGNWFLPSQDELNIMGDSRVIINAASEANGGSAFVPDGWYWSSTSISTESAFVQDIYDEGQSEEDKSILYRVRAAKIF